jgi:hypothetical protein
MGNNFFHRKGDILVQIWKKMWLVCMSSTTHESKFVNSGKKDWVGNKDAYLCCKIQYIKGVDRPNQYLSYYSNLRKVII